MQEAKTGVIDLKDVDADAFERVLVYLYTSDYFCKTLPKGVDVQSEGGRCFPSIRYPLSDNVSTME